MVRMVRWGWRVVVVVLLLLLITVVLTVLLLLGGMRGTMGGAKAAVGVAFMVVVGVGRVALEGGAMGGLHGVGLIEDALVATAATREGIHEAGLLLLGWRWLLLSWWKWLLLLLLLLHLPWVHSLGEAGWALEGWSRTLVGSSLGQGMSS